MKPKVKIVYIPDGEGGYEPGMHISKPVKRTSLLVLPGARKHTRGYVIALSSLHKYADDKYLAQKSIEIAEYLGYSTKNKSECYAIAVAINDNIDKVCDAYEYMMIEDDLEKHKTIAGDVDVKIDGDLVMQEKPMIERDERVLAGE